MMMKRIGESKSLKKLESFSPCKIDIANPVASYIILLNAFQF